MILILMSYVYGNTPSECTFISVLPGALIAHYISTLNILYRKGYFKVFALLSKKKLRFLKALKIGIIYK